MTNEKYYTPTTDEFCIGATYYIPLDQFEGTVWAGGNPVMALKKIGKEIDNHIEITIKSHSDYLELFCRTYDDYGLKELNHPPDAKMKYLDRQDIEECGFTERAGVYRHGDYELGCINGLWFVIEYDTPEDSDLIFRGSIKNKLELQRLMRQLGILLLPANK